MQSIYVKKSTKIDKNNINQCFPIRSIKLYVGEPTKKRANLHK